jgi:hypothetical protein
MPCQEYDPAQDSAPEATTADELVRDMLSFLMAEQLMKEPLLPSDREWMARAEEYLKSRNLEIPR